MVRKVAAAYWSKVHGCVKTSKTPRIDAKARLTLHPFRRDLNRKPRERKTRLNRYVFATKLAEMMGYDKSLVNPIDSSNLKQMAKRPMDSSLDVEKIERALDISMLNIDEALTIFSTQAKEGTM